MVQVRVGVRVRVRLKVRVRVRVGVGVGARVRSAAHRRATLVGRPLVVLALLARTRTSLGGGGLRGLRLDHLGEREKAVSKVKVRARVRVRPPWYSSYYSYSYFYLDHLGEREVGEGLG